MKKLTQQQENLQLLGIIGTDESNKLLKSYIKSSVREKISNDDLKVVKIKRTSVDYLKAVK
ncbi:hypothetical protein [Clostridium beijerinckii]|uniref:hypothetical protein n=1 Tax=Clostridium beijerinckii TaxID=1520 RepID=UPI002432B0D6|nr:hypothetical protein [Clostridium beijerinckii]MDG5852473.1 hypothetical protein [Clostridium beijerinckii]